MHRLVRSAPVRPGLTDTLLGLQAGTEAYYGHLKKARDLTTRAREYAHQNDDNETAAGYVCERCHMGNRNRRSEQGGSASPRRWRRLMLAVCSRGLRWSLARAGQAPRAQAIAAGLKKRFPLDTLINSLWVPTIEAAVELDRGNGARALELLEITSPYEHSSAMYFFSVYLRGEAYLKTRQDTHAASEFQKVLDNPGIVDNSIIGALAHLGLARASALDRNPAEGTSRLSGVLRALEGRRP